MNFGILALIPSLVAIIIALKTKQTLLSLFAGVWIGATIINGWNPITGFINIISDYMIPSIADSWNAGILVLVALVGGFAHMLKVSGAAQAFAQVVTKKINTRKKAQNVTWLSAFAFSYTEPVLILGTIVRPFTEKLRISRVKLAYILDSMGASLASISPISTYGPFIVGLIATQVTALGLSDNPWTLFIQMIPYNFYAIFSMFTVLFVINSGLDIGPMYKAEQRAITTGELIGENDKPVVEDEMEDLPSNYRLSINNFIVPMLLLFGTIFGVIFWTGDIVNNGIREAFYNGNIILAISSGFLVGAIGAGLISIVTGLKTVNSAVNEWTKGVIDFMFVPMILIMAWSISSVTKAMGLGEYLTQLVDTYLPAGIVPALIFVIGAVISFSTGSSWGVFSIMMPIAVPMAHSLGVDIPLAIGAVLSGGLFGDHCSPISDTTIMASTGAACDHIEHVRTQLPYSISVGVASFLGFLVGGLFNNGFLGIITSIIAIVIIFFILNRIAKRGLAKQVKLLSNN